MPVLPGIITHRKPLRNRETPTTTSGDSTVLIKPLEEHGGFGRSKGTKRAVQFDREDGALLRTGKKRRCAFGNGGGRGFCATSNTKMFQVS